MRSAQAKPHAWTAYDTTACRAGMYNARDGKGWQPCSKDMLSVEVSTARDQHAKQLQDEHRRATMHALRERGEELVRYAEAHGG